MSNNNQTLAINSITGHGEKGRWCSDTQLIVACDFISDNNLDEHFDLYLKRRLKIEKDMSG